MITSQGINGYIVEACLGRIAGLILAKPQPTYTRQHEYVYDAASIV